MTESERAIQIAASVIDRCTEELPDDDPFVIITALLIAAAMMHTAHRLPQTSSDNARMWFHIATESAITIAERTRAITRS